MMARFEIPLSPEAQTFRITLGGVAYDVRVLWNTYDSMWVVDLADAVTKAEVLTGIPLVAGLDLFGPFGYLNLGGELIATTDGAALLPPTYENLGILGRVYFDTGEDA